MCENQITVRPTTVRPTTVHPTTVSQMMNASQKIHSQRLVDHPGKYDFHHDFMIAVMRIQMMMLFSVICARLESRRDASKFHTSGLTVILVENGRIHIVPSDGMMSLVSIYVSIAFNFKSCCKTCILPS